MSLPSSQGLSFMSQLDPEEQQEVIRRHLNIASETDNSSGSGESDFDDDYLALKPPPPIGSDTRWNNEGQDSVKLESGLQEKIPEKPKPKVPSQAGQSISYLPNAGVLPTNPLYSTLHYQPRYPLVGGTPVVPFHYQTFEERKLAIKQNLSLDFKKQESLQNFIVNFELVLTTLFPFHLCKAFQELVSKVPQLPEAIILNQPLVHRTVIENAIRAVVQRSIMEENLIGILTPKHKHKLQIVDGICHALGSLDDMFYQMWIRRLDVRTKYMEYLLTKRSLFNVKIKEEKSTYGKLISSEKTSDKSNVKETKTLDKNKHEESLCSHIKEELKNEEEYNMTSLLDIDFKDILEETVLWTETSKKANKKAVKQPTQESVFEIKNSFFVLGNDDADDSVDDEIIEEPEDNQQQVTEMNKPKKKKKKKNKSRKLDSVEQKSKIKNKSVKVEAELTVIKKQISQQLQQIYEMELKKYFATSTLKKILEMKSPTGNSNWAQIKTEAAELAEVLLNFNIQSCSNHLILEVVKILKDVSALEDIDTHLEQIKAKIKKLVITEPCVIKGESKSKAKTEVQYKSNVFSMSVPLKAEDNMFLLLKNIAEASNKSRKDLSFFKRAHDNDFQLSIVIEELEGSKSTYKDNIVELLPIEQMEAIGVKEENQKEAVVYEELCSKNNEPCEIKNGALPCWFRKNDNTDLMPYTPKSNIT